jgi:DNA replication protein DnaC
MPDNSPRLTPDLKILPEPPEITEQERRIKTLTWLGVTNVNHNFQNMKHSKGFTPAMNAFKEMATGAALYSMLMVYGVTGNGKTMGCEAVVIAMYDRGLRVSRDRWSDLVRNMKSHFNGRGAVTYEEYFRGLRERSRLILDDVGSGSTLGSWEWGELEDIIDYRYERNLFTIVTTNLDIKQFPERILSRFRDKSKARMILNEAADQRPLQ